MKKLQRRQQQNNNNEINEKKSKKKVKNESLTNHYILDDEEENMGKEMNERTLRKIYLFSTENSQKTSLKFSSLESNEVLLFLDDSRCSSDESIPHSISNGFGSSNDENHKIDSNRLDENRHLHLLNDNCYSSNENLHGEITDDPLNRGQNPIDKLYSMTQNSFYCSAC